MILKKLNAEFAKVAEKTLRNLFIIILMMIFISCELPHQPGPMPKEIIDLKFEAGLNILGIVRLNGDNAESFVLIDEALKTKDYYKYEETDFEDVSVVISSNDSSFNFIMEDEIDSIRYRNQNFIPKEKETYHLEIGASGNYGDLHLTAETIVPTIPSMDTNSIVLENDEITFDVFTTEDAFRYDVVLFFENEDIQQSVFINKNGQRNIKFNFSDKLGMPLYIGIAAYDKNLTEYLNATSSIIPQTYQEDISTVNEGYGCFGAISIEAFNIRKIE